MIKYLDELKKLNLQKNKYAIFGSGCLAIRNLRENKDIDIIVKDDLWGKLAKKYPLNEKGHIEIGNIEICKNALYLKESVGDLIDNADIINRFRFIKLKYLLKWKKLMNRKKDIKDIKLIKEHLREK